MPPKSLPDRLRACGRAWHVWIPVVILVIFCLPRLHTMLPAPVDFADEIYQPSQTLKFVASKGRAFDKYGPTLNYFLLPIYGVTFLYWKITGAFSRPSGDWPYGFSRPLEQLGFLIFQTRILLLLLSGVMLGIVAYTIERITFSRLVALLATLLVLVGNYNVLWHAPLARPDTTMLVFLMIAIALVLRMATDVITPGRSIWLGLCSAAAVGAKENAGPILALTLVALLVFSLVRSWADGDGRRGVIRGAIWTVVTGAIAYALTNIVLSPSAWLARMRYWLVDDGLSGDVWARSNSLLQHAQFAGEALWNNLGPAGVVVIPLLVIVALIRRPTLTVLTLVPVLGCAITVFAIPYTPDRFVLPGAAALVFPAGLGLAELLRARARPFVLALSVLAIGLNLWWCTITFHINATTEQAMLERAADREDKSLVKAYAVMFADPPSMRRLQRLGHAVDMRAMQAWTDASHKRPDIVFANSGRMQMLDEARHMPGRAEYYRHLAKFELDTWPGMTGLGYAEAERFTVPPPAYLKPLTFMPLFRELRHRDVLIYRRATGE